MKKTTPLTTSTTSFFLILFSLLIVSCGENGSGGSISPKTAPAPIPTFSLKGQSIDGLLLNSDVKIYSLNATGGKASILGQTRTNLQGDFNVFNIVVTPQPILIEVCNGYYREEATNEIRYLNANECLTSYDFVQKNGQNRHYTVSGLTHMASAYTRHMLKTTKNLEHAINEGRITLTAMLGFSAHSTVFKDITSDKYKGYAFSHSPYGFTYSLFVAGVSEFVKSISKGVGNYNSITYWQLLYQDIINDGVIDGQGANGKLAIGTTILHPNQIRSQATRLGNNFFLKGSDTNKHGSKIARNQVDKDRLLIQLSAINKNSNKIYRGIDFTPMDNVPPIPQWDLAYRSGAFTLTTYTITYTEDNALKSVIATITDKSGIADTIFSIQGIEALKRETNNKKVLHFPVNYKRYRTGQATLKITMTDEYDNSTDSTKILYFVNDKPSVTFSTKTKKISQGTLNIEGTFTMPTTQVGIKSIVFNWTEGRSNKTKEATINKANSTWAISIKPSLAGARGKFDFNVVSCDTIGNCHTQTYTGFLDNQAPIISAENTNEKPILTWDITNQSTQTGSGLLVSFLHQGVKPNYPSEASYSHIVYYPYGKHTKGKIALDSNSLGEAKIPFVTFVFADRIDGNSYATANNKLKVTVEYSTAVLRRTSYLNKNQQLDLTLKKVFKKEILLHESPIIAGGKRSILFPFTTEYLGQNFKNTNPNTSHILRFTVCDEANNCTWTAYNFQAMFEPPKAEHLGFTTANPSARTTAIVSKPLSRRSSILNSRIILHEARFRNVESKSLYIKPKPAEQHFSVNVELNKKVVTNSWQKQERNFQCVGGSYPFKLGGLTNKNIYLNQLSKPNDIRSSTNCDQSYLVINGCSEYRGKGGTFWYDCYFKRSVTYYYDKFTYVFAGTTGTVTTNTRSVGISTQSFVVSSDQGEILPNLDGYYKILPQQRITIKTEALVQTSNIYQDYQAITKGTVGVGTWRHDTRSTISYTPKTVLQIIFSDDTGTRPTITPKVLTATGTRVSYSEARK